jgi:hypothetical protein
MKSCTNSLLFFYIHNLGHHGYKRGVNCEIEKSFERTGCRRRGKIQQLHKISVLLDLTINKKETFIYTLMLKFIQGYTIQRTNLGSLKISLPAAWIVLSGLRTTRYTTGPRRLRSES